MHVPFNFAFRPAMIESESSEVTYFKDLNSSASAIETGSLYKKREFPTVCAF